jgi:hypothetical protein
MQTAGQNVLGRSGAVIFALLISVACLGSININVFTSARLTISAVNKGYLPKLLSGHGHVTSNKRNPPLMKELGLGASQQAPTTKDDQCGALRGSRD